MSSTPSAPKNEKPTPAPPAANRPAPSPSSAEATRLIDWLDWLPWEKILIWGLFLLAVYTLRHFFFIIFMTFILAYNMRSVVARIAKIASPRKRRNWLERSLTVICFALFLFGIYEAAVYFGPRLVDQAKGLVQRGTELELKKEVDNLMNKTLGAIMFQRKYGGPGDPRYEAAFERSKEQHAGTQAYERFPELRKTLEKKSLQIDRERILADVATGPESDKEFEAWFLREKAPGIFEADRNRFIEEYERSYEFAYRSRIVAKPLSELKKEPEYEKNRDESILGGIRDEELGNAKKREALRKEWENRVVAAALASFQSSKAHEEAFREFYEAQRSSTSILPQDRPPYTYEKYKKLCEAHSRGLQAFVEVLQETESESKEERRRRVQAAFEYEEQGALAKEFMESDVVKDVLKSLSPYGESAIASVTGWIRDGIAYLVTIPIQLALSLLLSFFITFDMPRIRSGVLQLKKSRVSEFYEEIAPGLYNFGRLIGRAFQAQGVIAFFNTVLTFFALQLVGIHNEVFLCAIVFLCSFIPVLGVVLSSVPIAVMAIVQPDGRLEKALEIVGAILVIHFIETSILNPKILGDMLHLHPVMVLAVLAVGEHFAGVWGLLLGVPIAVYILRCVILNEEIPGLIEQSPLSLEAPPDAQGAPGSPGG